MQDGIPGTRSVLDIKDTQEPETLSNNVKIEVSGSLYLFNQYSW